jgi:hypothetical protein
VELAGTIVDFAFRLSEGFALAFAVIAVSSFVVPRRSRKTAVPPVRNFS